MNYSRVVFVIDYNFRKSTTDIDAIILASSAMKLCSGRKYKNFEDLYRKTCNEEEISKISLVEFEQEYPNSLNHNNVDDILEMLQNKK